jgi:two-component system chemotaxis response regulator CheY
MPVRDGVELVRQLSVQEATSKIPVVMMIRKGSGDEIGRALSAGARGYIRDPFTSDQIKEHVVPVLEREPKNASFA